MAAARISSSVAGGSKLARVLMLRHMLVPAVYESAAAPRDLSAHARPTSRSGYGRIGLGRVVRCPILDAASRAWGEYGYSNYWNSVWHPRADEFPGSASAVAAERVRYPDPGPRRRRAG